MGDEGLLGCGCGPSGEGWYVDTDDPEWLGRDPEAPPAPTGMPSVEAECEGCVPTGSGMSGAGGLRAR